MPSLDYIDDLEPRLGKKVAELFERPFSSTSHDQHMQVQKPPGPRGRIKQHFHHVEDTAFRHGISSSVQDAQGVIIGRLDGASGGAFLYQIGVRDGRATCRP